MSRLAITLSLVANMRQRRSGCAALFYSRQWSSFCWWEKFGGWASQSSPRHRAPSPLERLWSHF